MKRSVLFVIALVVLAGQQTPLVAKEVHQRAMIRVGVYDNCPKICLHETGKPQGIFIDIIESIANSQQWDIEFVPGTWKQLVSMLELGAIDVLPDMAYSAGRDSLFSLTTLPVLESWLSIFRTADTDVHSVRDLEGKTVGVLTGSIQATYLENDVKDLFGIDFSLTGYVDYKSKVAALKRGETDAIVADRFFYFSDLFEEDILPTGVVLRPTQLHFAFPADIHPDVVSLFDGHISYLKNTSNSDYYKSLDRWLDREHVFGIPLYLKWVLALISIGLALVFIFTVVLKQRVNARTMELERINRELTKAKDKAEENNRLKSAFLANISHEIRTPMNAILGFLELLKQPDLSDELQRKHIDIIGKSSQRLHDTIGDIVAISVIESAQMVVRREKVCIRDVMDYCYSLKPWAEPSGWNRTWAREAPSFFRSLFPCRKRRKKLV